MSDLQIQCPKCQRRYLASPIQLSLSHGQVCCVACDFAFNAYPHLHLKPVAKKAASHEVEFYNPDLDPTKNIADHPALEIFTRTIASSNIDFKTYLNNTPYFDLHQTHQPVINQRLSLSNKHNAPNRLIMLLLVIFMLILILVIIFQFLVHQHVIKQHTNFFHSHFSANAPDLAVAIVGMNEDVTQHKLLTVQIKNTGSHPQRFPLLKVGINRNDTIIFTPQQYLVSAFSNQMTLAAQQTLNVSVQIPTSFNRLHTLKVHLSTAPNQ